MAWAPNYATADELAAYSRLVDEARDYDQLELAVFAASRAIDDATGRQFGRDDEPTSRYYTARFDTRRGRWVVDIDDLMTDAVDVRVDVDGTGDYAGEVTAYTLAPRNAAAEGRPWTQLVVSSTSDVQPTASVDGVEVTATFGWSTVPDTIRQATLLQASRFLMRRDSPFGVAGSPDQGSELRLLAKIDPDVHVMVHGYTRRRVKVG